MLVYPYMMLFLSIMVLSTFVGISSSHLFMVWMAFELNMLSFIPIISYSSWFQETESCVKYFMFQAFGSSLLLLGIMSNGISYVVIFGLLVKLGVAPFHFWYPSVMAGCSWFVCGLLMTWQKILPLFLIVYCFDSVYNWIVLTCGALSSAIGGLGGLNQTRLRPLLGYSSIGHMGWILCGSYYSKVIGMIYFSFYFLISLCIIWVFMYMTAYFPGSKFTHFSSSFFFFFSSLGLLISLGGMPPFTGFFPKWLVISSLNSLSLLVILLLGSLINLYYYLNVCFSFFLHRSSNNKMNEWVSPPLMLYIMCFLSIFGLPVLWYALVLFY